VYERERETEREIEKEEKIGRNRDDDKGHRKRQN
jgi:hypothetical protein